MAMRAKIFTNDRRVKRRVILNPADEWPPEFLDALGAWKEEIPRPSRSVIPSRVDGEESPESGDSSLRSE